MTEEIPLTEEQLRDGLKEPLKQLVTHVLEQIGTEYPPKAFQVRDFVDYALQQGVSFTRDYHDIFHFLEVADVLPADKSRHTPEGLQEAVRQITEQGREVDPHHVLAGLTHDMVLKGDGSIRSYEYDAKSYLNDIGAKISQKDGFHEIGKINDEEASRLMADEIFAAMTVSEEDRMKVSLLIESTKHFFGDNSNDKLLTHAEAHFPEAFKAMGEVDVEAYIRSTVRPFSDRDIAGFDPEKTTLDAYLDETIALGFEIAVKDKVLTEGSREQEISAMQMQQSMPLELAGGLKKLNDFHGAIINAVETGNGAYFYESDEVSGDQAERLNQQAMERSGYTQLMSKIVAGALVVSREENTGLSLEVMKTVREQAGLPNAISQDTLHQALGENTAGRMGDVGTVSDNILGFLKETGNPYFAEVNKYAEAYGMNELAQAGHRNFSGLTSNAAIQSSVLEQIQRKLGNDPSLQVSH